MITSEFTERFSTCLDAAKREKGEQIVEPHLFCNLLRAKIYVRVLIITTRNFAGRCVSTFAEKTTGSG